jgi:hemerythrin
MAYTWTSDLETGNLTIDTQHKQLIQAINDLTAACALGKAGESLNKTLDFLHSYTLKHFGDEENLQRQYNYPDYPNHKNMHTGFVSVVSDLAAAIKREGPTIGLVSKITSAVGDWLLLHIKREDTKVAAHIRSAEKG